jgi:hypothetical protein
VKLPTLLATTLTTCALVGLTSPGVATASTKPVGPKIIINIRTHPARGRKPTQMTATAKVTGVTPPPNSIVDFYIYGPDAKTCSPTTFFASFGNNLVGPDGKAQAGHISVFTTGTYQWVAVYHAAGNYSDPNQIFTSRCGAAKKHVVVPTG